ncbi:hypothetical protein CP061683_0797B, partial [Chlamydia psittaci 06-1683]
TWDQSSYDNTD